MLCLRGYDSPLSHAELYRVVASMELAQMIDGLWRVVGFHTVISEFEFATQEVDGWHSISAAEAYAMTQELNEFIILDVRTQDEFDERHIAGAVLIPYDELLKRLLELDKDVPILVYCRSGRRSAIAAQTLSNAGFMHIYDFGGIIDWSW